MAAIQVLAEEGPRGISAKKIADLAGVSKSNIFHHFESIDGMFNALFDSVIETITGQVNKEEFSSVEEFLRLLGYAVITENEEELMIFKVLFSFVQEIVYQEKFKSKMNELKAVFGMYIRRQIKELGGFLISEELTEIISIDVDSIGFYYALDPNLTKYRQLWGLKCKMFLMMIEKEQKENSEKQN